MNWELLLSAFALVFVIEGMLPFINPKWWRKMILTIMTQPDSALRLFGLVNMLLGLLLLYFIKS